MLKEYLPDYYQKSISVGNIMSAQQEEADKMQAAEVQLKKNMQASQAVTALDRWEKEYGITTNTSASQEARTSNLIAKMRGQGATTKSMIKAVSESYSNGEVEITEVTDKFMCNIKFVSTKGIPPNLSDLTETLYELIPAHADFTYYYTYNTWGQVATMTWAQAAAYTWEQIRTR